MRRITVEMLREHQACSDQVRKVELLFPKGAPVSMRSAEKAMAAGLDLSFVGCFLSAPAVAEYDRVTAAAWAEYKRVTAPALAEYKRVTAPAWAEYDRATALALVAGLLAS